MIRTVFTLIFIFFLQGLFSQKIYFPKTQYADSTAFDGAMQGLASKVLANYDSAHSRKPNDDSVRLLVLSGQLDAVPKAVTSTGIALYGDSVTTKDIDFNFKLYALIQQQHPVGTADFNRLYSILFDSLYKEMIPVCQGYVETMLSTDPATLKARFKNAADRLSKSDSLTVAEALFLCRVYADVKVAAVNGFMNMQTGKQLESAKYIITDSMTIKMPDGGTVTMNIVRDKKLTAPQPVVLMYDIYATKDQSRNKIAVSKGYTGIIANTRGKKFSSDTIEPFEHDARDAYYIIDWISKQPWCNGKIGMYGGSYLGFSQWSAAKYLHPALKTIVPQVAVNPGIDYPAQNGIFMSYMLRWIHYVSDLKLTDRAGFQDQVKWGKTFGDWYLSGKSFRSLDTLEGRPNRIFQRWLDHPSYDKFWQDMTAGKKEMAALNIPILTTTGYYDDDQLGAMRYYNDYLKSNKNPDYYLLIGPWDHGGSQGYPKATMGGYRIDSVGNIVIADLLFEWFDHVLKGKPLPAMLKDRVTFEIMGKNEWHSVPGLDKMHNDSLKLYLGAKQEDNTYALVKTPPKLKSYIPYEINFADRKLTDFHFDASSSDPEVITDTILDESHTKLVFMSGPVTEPFAISGKLTASLMASINKKDIDIVIELYEKTPGGKYFFLNTQSQRASYAKNKSKRQLLQPGKVEQIDMTENFITCRQLQKGSRIVVTIGVNKNPEWQINMGTGKDVSDETIKDAAVPLQVKWYNSSFIKFDILK